MNWLKTKFHMLFEIPHDIVKVFVVEYMPKIFFKLCYALGLFNRTKLEKYNSPSFKLNSLKEINLELESQKLIDLSTRLFNASYSSDFSQKICTESFSSTDKEKVNQFKFVKIVTPAGWNNPETVGGRTQGPQIEFLRQGLISCGLKVAVIEVGENLNGDFQDHSLDKLLMNKEDLGCTIVFIWSITMINPKTKAFDAIREMKKDGNYRGQIIGINTASPNLAHFPRFNEWTNLLDGLIYHEEKSAYKQELEKLFKVRHMPFIQITSPRSHNSTHILPSIHSSCLLKQNRLSWLITLRYICLSLDYRHLIRAISNPLAWAKLHSSYTPNEDISAERNNFMLGFVMVHREPNLDCHLIGSFWDYYRLGVIPIIQMQNLSDFATYMTPYLDYFPVVSELDLYLVLKISKENPQHFRNLQKRILERMDHEFTPNNTVRNVLEQFNISL